MTPPTVLFIVPGEPVPKERAEPTIRRAAGKLRVSFRQGDRTAEYEACVRMIAQAARPAGWPMRCRYRVDLTICRSEPGVFFNDAATAEIYTIRNPLSLPGALPI